MDINFKKSIENKLTEALNVNSKITSEQYADLIQDLLEERRISWQTELVPIFDKMRGSVEILLDIQSEYLSYRQMIIEEAGFVNSLIVKDISKIKKKRSLNQPWYV